MQTVTITFYRFNTGFGRYWALVQMAFTNARLRRIADIGFAKVLGTGTGESFYPLQNLGVYGILATWPDIETARTRLAEARVFRQYRRHASETYTVYLECARAWGQWDGKAPFAAAGKPRPGPVGIITRAELKKRHLPAFWRRVPAISHATVQRDHLLFKLGMGEIPLLNQVTFSIWDDFDAMVTFAYRAGAHREAVCQVREKGWFREQLFARFSVIASEGSWGGYDPLARANAEAPAEPPLANADAA